MRSSRILILAGIILVTASAGAGYVLTTRLGPERLARESERVLGDRIGPTEVGGVRLGFRWGPALELRDVRIAAGAGGESLGADRVSLTFDLWSLLRRQPRLDRVELVSVWADVTRTHDGAWRPEPVRRLIDELAAADADPAGKPTLGGLPRILVRSGRIRLHQLAEDGTEAAVLGLEDVDLSLHERRLFGGIRLQGSGRVTDAHGASSGAFQVQVLLPQESQAEVEVALTDLALETLEPWLRDLGGASAPSDLEGRGSALLGWTREASEERLNLEILGFDLSGRAAGAQRVELGDAHLRVVAELEPDLWTARELELRVGALEIAGNARLGRPSSPSAPLGLQLQVDRIGAEALRGLLTQLVPPEAEWAQAVEDYLVAGQLSSLSVVCPDASLDRWQRFLDSPLSAWPSGLAITAEFSDVEIALPGEDPLRELGGRIRVADDVLRLNGKGMLGEVPLPDAQFTVAGLSALLDGFEQAPLPEAVAPQPGFLTFAEWIESQRTPRPGAPSRWTRIEIDADWIDHPALLRPVERALATLTPDDPGIKVDLWEAFWAGARVTGRGGYWGPPPGRLQLELEASPYLREWDPPETSDAWMRGRMKVDLNKLGPFRSQSLAGEVRAVGQDLEVRDADLRLAPSGRVQGEIDFDVSRDDRVPFAAALQLEDGLLEQLSVDLGSNPGTIRGKLIAGAGLEGNLIPGTHVLSDVVGPISGHARNGAIRRGGGLSQAVAEASAEEDFLGAGETIPFDGLDGEFELVRGGTLKASSMALLGPTRRMVATGKIDLVGADNLVEGVLGVFFFRTLDQVIGALPVLNTLLLGSDENLVSAYFSVRGPWLDPRVDLIPGKTLTAGPGSVVFEGVPGFVRSGLSQLRKIFIQREDASIRAATP